MSEGNLKIILLRHGESTWNRENRFAGTSNVPLTDKGRYEAAQAGMMLGQASIKIDRVFTSKLDRAIETADIVLSNARQANHRPMRDQRMDERDYGTILTGRVKNDPALVKEHGEAIMKARRGYYDRPPGGESLHDVDVNRVTPFADEHIRPWLEYNRNQQAVNVADNQVAAQFNQSLNAKFEGIQTIAIVAHGNSLRAFLRTMEIETVESIPNVEFDTGVPEVLEFDQSGNYLKRYKLEPVAEPAAEPHAAVN